MSYISWYVLGGMGLTCLPIFAWQWGRKHNNTEKNAAFWMKPHSSLILWQHGVFSFTNVCIFFTNGVYQDFYHNIMILWFLENSVCKKMHNLPRCGLIFPFQMPYVLHRLFSSTLLKLTQLKLPEAPEQAAKKVEGTALKLPLGLTRPGPCEPKFWKNDLPANLFLLCVLPQKRNKFTPAF